MKENLYSSSVKDQQPMLNKEEKVKIVSQNERITDIQNLQDGEVEVLKTKITELNNELEEYKEKLSVIQTRYATLLNFVQIEKNQHVDINDILDKVDELEKQHLAHKAEISKLKAKIEENQWMSRIIRTGERKSSGLIEKKNIGNFFNFKNDRINGDSQRKRKSSQQQENSSFWDKVLEDVAKQKLGILKLKEKIQTTNKKIIPVQYRRKLWPLLFENDSGITDSLYIELLEKKEKYCDEVIKSQIEKDIHRSFPPSLQSGEKKALSQDVKQILQVFHQFRPDISYVQGMSYPVIILTSIVGKLTAFRIFANLATCYSFFRKLYTFDPEFMPLCWRVFDFLLKQYSPELAQRMSELNIRSEIFLIEWFFTILSRGLSTQTILKLWDQLSYQGQVLLYKFALSIFELIGRHILLTNYQQTIGLIQSYWSYLDEDRLLTKILKHQLTREKLNKIFDKLSN